jgi:hypothetical protein
MEEKVVVQKRRNTQTKDMKGRLKHGEKLM